MQIVVALLALITGITLLITDYKTEHMRYLSGICFLGVISLISDYMWKIMWYKIISLDYFHAFLTQFCEHYMFYLFSIYSICYSGIFSNKIKSIIKILLLFAVTIAFFIFPAKPNQIKMSENTYISYYSLLSIWVVPCVLCGIFLLARAYLHEKNPRTKRQRLVNLAVVAPVALSVSLNLIVLRALGKREAMEFNLIVIILVFMLLLFLMFKSGVFGMRLRYERAVLGSNIDSISSGTSIFNHTLKNEVNKISLSTLNIKKFADLAEPNIVGIKDNVEILENSTSHLTKMIYRLKEFSSDIKLQETKYPICEIIDKAVLNCNPYISEGNIDIKKNYNYIIDDSCLLILFIKFSIPPLSQAAY